MSIKDKLLYKFSGAQLTYSQFGEDLILEHIFNMLGIRKISYLDIGSNDPKKCNNTYKFYEHGSKGVCVEPNPALCELIKKVRPKDTCLAIGVGTGEEQLQPFYVMHPHTLSTFSKEDAEALAMTDGYSIQSVIQTPVRNINAIIRENFASGPDLVSIDVEGLNEEIALSFDFSIYRPKVFCMETVTYSPSNQGKKLEKIIDFFKGHNYSLYADTHVNSIFVDAQLK